MSATIFQQEATAFHDRVMREHHAAMQFADVRDFLRLGRSMAEATIAAVRDRLNDGELGSGDSAKWQAVCRRVLAWMTAIKSTERKLEDAGFVFPGDAVGPFDDSTFELRDVLAALIDPRPWDSVALPSEASMSKCKEPPQSWYDENQTKLLQSV